ncbi:hypothetical protein EDB19DRAFT_1906709 [Suillus lakei]|nr:hypothetical protein EDB19DRAFT_1906709 [Suillus lakei]
MPSSTGWTLDPLLALHLLSVSGWLALRAICCAPPFLSSPTSLTEFPAYWCERPALFAAIVDGKPQQARVFAVLKWFISSIKGQYTSRNESMGSAKKLLNPTLGLRVLASERGSWRKNYPSRGTFLPPPSNHSLPHGEPRKWRYLDKTQRIEDESQRGSIIVKQVGHAALTVSLPSGDRGQKRATSKVLLAGCLRSNAKAKATSPENHTFKVTLTPPSHIHASPHVIEGTWHTTSKESHSGVAFHDVTSPKEEITVAPLEEQGEWESRKLWYGVAKGIREGDFESAALFNGKIENKQMQRRSDESTGGMTWELKHFKHVEHDPVCAYASLLSLSLPDTNSNSLCEDEHLGKLFKANPLTEDGYVYLGNGPISSLRCLASTVVYL